MVRVWITITREYSNIDNAVTSLKAMREKVPKEWTLERTELQE